MPRGYYLGQGLIPLGEDSSDDDEGPCELPDGRIVCGPHGLVVCGRCCTDYNFDGGDDDDDIQLELDTFSAQLLWEHGGLNGVRANPPPLQRGSQDRAFASSNPVTKHVANAVFTSQAKKPEIPIAGDIDHEDMFEDMLGPKMRRGTGRVFPTRFTPPSTSIKPTELFRGQATYARLTRYIHRNDPRKILIFTDGACLNNGQPNPKAGWALVDGPSRSATSGPLENEGPFGDAGVQSSNRAELRAVIAALRLRHWAGEGFNSVVIATDSEYVTAGSTEWVKSWTRNGWKTAGKASVKNKDLWEMLLGEVERWNDEGLSVQFWKIPREWNEVADAAAKKAAATDEDRAEWTEVMGMCV